MCITYLSRDSCRNLICKNLVHDMMQTEAMSFIFRFEVDLSLGVQCRNISISALTCLEKRNLETKKNHAPRNKKQVSYLCIALRCKDNCSWFFKKINKISI